jgi:hypothetical protein
MSDEPLKPLSTVQAYLVEIKKCIGLFREVCVEIKDLLAILTVIIFFIFGVYEALSRLIVQPTHVEAQTVSKPVDSDRK